MVDNVIVAEKIEYLKRNVSAVKGSVKPILVFLTGQYQVATESNIRSYITPGATHIEVSLAERWSKWYSGGEIGSY